MRTREECRERLDQLGVPYTSKHRLPELRKLVELTEAEIRLGLRPGSTADYHPVTRFVNHDSLLPGETSDVSRSRARCDPMGGSYRR